MSNRKKIYKIVFVHQSKVYELYAKGISQGTLYGFIEIEEILFGERSSVVVDPSEESLKTEFREVVRTYVPMHAVIRIDEVEKEGTARIRDREKGDHTVMPFTLNHKGPNKEA
jgi:hypothetical protein